MIYEAWIKINEEKVLKIFQSFAQGAISSGGFFQTVAFLGANVKNFLKKWNLLCGSCVFLGFGLCHYRNLLVGQNFADTTKQVLYAICFGMFLAALFIQTNHLFIPVLVHGLCNFSNFL